MGGAYSPWASDIHVCHFCVEKASKCLSHFISSILTLSWQLSFPFSKPFGHVRWTKVMKCLLILQNAHDIMLFCLSI